MARAELRSPSFRRCLGPVGRRDILQAGTLGALGLGLEGLWSAAARGDTARATTSEHGPGFGSAKRCILLFQWGGPSHLDTLDPKPNAPAEVRGEFRAIDTVVPGIQISELLPQTAARMDRLAVLRSLTHNDPAHLSSAHAAYTGHLAPNVVSDKDPPSPNDTPHLGSVVARMRATSGGLPPFVMMPWKVFHPAAPGGVAPGQHGGWLGASYDPFLAAGDPSKPGWSIPELGLVDGVQTGRLNDRRSLLASLDGARRSLDLVAERTSMDEHQARAFGLLASSESRAAFAIADESPETRARYGQNIHGQCVLLARRLIERGVPLVAVNWHNDGRNFWDTHGNNFNRLRNDLCPPSDQALAALLDDLDERGLADDTLVVWVGEFGRNPTINKNAAGRDHWPYCFSGMLAGAGVKRGYVHGASDRIGGRPAESPTSPRDLVATIYHALGIPVDGRLPDRSGRPMPYCDGEAVLPLFG
jgi:hypothetical protein